MTVCGDGGMVVSNNEEFAKSVAMLRDCGRKSKYEQISIGYTNRLNTVNAAIGRIQLKHLPEWIEKRREIAKLYNELLEEIDIVLPFEAEWAKHVYHLYVVRHPERDRLKDFLKEKGVASGIHYPIPVHLQPAIKGILEKSYKLEVTEKVAKEVLSLPIYPWMEEEKVEYVANAIKEWLRK